MDEIITLILIGGILGIVALFGYYIFKTYVMPRRIEEFAEMINQGQTGPAITRLQKLLEENDRDPYIHFLLAEAYFREKKVSQATMEFRQVLKIGKFSNKVKEEAIRGRLAKIYLQNRNLEEAKKEFLILTKLEPSNADNFFQVGLLFENAGLVDKALPYFKQTIKVHRNHADAYYHMGVIEYNLANIPNAKVSLTEAVKLNPNLFGAHYYLGLCLKNQKDYEWALKEFDKALGDESLKGKAYLARGLCFYEKDQHVNAAKEFEKGITVAPRSSELELNLRYSLAATAEKRRDFHTAIANWERIVDVNPKFRDAADKLKLFDEFRQDDSIKDFMIASPAKFETVARKFVENMELSVLDLSVENDSEVHILATETESTFRNTKRTNRLIYIFRTTDAVQEKTIRAMHEDMRTKGATRGLIISTGDYSAQALLFAQSRPIELLGKKEMIAFLKMVH